MFSLLVSMLLAGETAALSGRGKLLGKYIWLGFELSMLRETSALWLSLIRFAVKRLARSLKQDVGLVTKSKAPAYLG